MPKTKRGKITRGDKQIRLANPAQWLRTITTHAILILIVCYVLGATGLAGRNKSGYILVAVVCTVLFGGAFVIRNIFISRRNSSTLHWRNMLIAPVFIFIPALIEFYIINHVRYYWIILLILVAALVLNLFEFGSRLREIWHGNAHSREKTLVQFVYLYATTIFSFAFLYTILQVYSSEPVFYITYRSDAFLDFLYLSTITVTTLGYGDIIPITPLAKVLVMIQTLIGYLFLSVMVGLVVSWLGGRHKE